ncbi:MAG: hypothetical protein HBSIN02_24710 [Bacteroidia bacterium]|nr:MAG: hypothetical protein HBSIN02_24710 [Bacteroidia bacterium]
MANRGPRGTERFIISARKDKERKGEDEEGREKKLQKFPHSVVPRRSMTKGETRTQSVIILNKDKAL